MRYIGNEIDKKQTKIDNEQANGDYEQTDRDRLWGSQYIKKNEIDNE